MSGTLVHAQKIQDTLSKYTSENGQGYLQPMADAFGADMNSGFFHHAKVKKAGLSIYAGMVTMTAFVAEDQKTFTASTEELFYPPATAEAPTIFGKSESVAIEGVGGTAYLFPPGFDVKMVPVAVPQVSIGSLLGTEALLRYMDLDLGENWGQLQLFGWGVRHSISQYLASLPFDLAVGFYQQNFEIGDIVEANTTLISAQASRTRGVLTLYGGLGHESSNLDIEYTAEGDPESERSLLHWKDKIQSASLLGLDSISGRWKLHGITTSQPKSSAHRFGALLTTGDETMSKRILAILSAGDPPTQLRKTAVQIVIDLNEMKTFSIDHTVPSR
jgi:hypothetical protein